MRHLLAGVLGLLLTAAFALAAGRGIAPAFAPAEGSPSMAPASYSLGLVWMLAAGVCLGLLVHSRRMSPVPPLVGAVVLLMGTLVGAASPGAAPGSPGSAWFGLHVLNGYGLGALAAALLLVIAAAPAGRRSSRSGG